MEWPSRITDGDVHDGLVKEERRWEGKEEEEKKTEALM